MPINTTIYLVRHCEYENKPGIIPFRLPGFPLSRNGIECAKKLGQFFLNKNIVAIYTSPITRARQTAEIIGKTINLKPKKSKDVIETKTPLQGMNLEDFNKKRVSKFLLKNHQVGGESIQDVFNRSKKLIDKIVKEHAGKSSIVVTHADSVMMLIHGLGDGDPEKYLSKSRPYVPTGGVAKLVFEGKHLALFEQLNY